MRQFAGLMALALALATGLWAAGPPITRPVRLTAEQQRQIDRLQKEAHQAGEAGRFELAEAKAKQLAELRERFQGGRHWETIDALFNVDNWTRLTKVPAGDRPVVIRARTSSTEVFRLINRGRYLDAEKKSRETLALTRQLLGEDHPDTAYSHDSLGHCLGSQGQAGKALPHFERALQVRHKLLGEVHPDTAYSHDSLATCLGALGQAGKALLHLERALQVYRKLLGEDHPATARSYDKLATCLVRLGRAGEALPHHERALQLRRKLLGEDHLDTADSYINLATCLESLGQAGKALPHHERALQLRRKLLGEDHLDTADSYINLATCLESVGQSGKALPHHERALHVTRKLLGQDHPGTARSHDALARCLERLGQAGKALPHFERALLVYRKLLGEDHPSTASSLNNLAYCLQSVGQSGKALPHFERALQLRRKLLGEDHPDTAGSLNNLAYCLQSLGQSGKALPYFEQALQLYRKLLGEEHPVTATSLNNLATCLERLGQAEKALPLHERVLQVRRKLLGEVHPDTADSYNNLATCLESLGQAGKALPYFERALQLRKLLGEELPATADSYNNLAACLARLGQAGKALPHFKRALQLRRKLLGEEHPDTATSHNNLSICLDRLGRVAEAGRLLQAALPGQEASRFNAALSGFDRTLVLANRVSPHTLLAIQLARLGQPTNAFRHAEASLARGLLDDLARTDPGDADRIGALLIRSQELDAQFLKLSGRGELSQEEASLRDDLDRQRRRVGAELAELASGVSTRQLMPRADIQRVLLPDDALVLWIDATLLEQYWACVLRREGEPAWVPLSGSGKDGDWTPDDQSVAHRYYQSLHDLATPAAQREQLRTALRRQRMEPLKVHLKGVRRLFVVPTGDLARVPLELLTPDLAVTAVPSASMMARMLKQHRTLSTDSLLALGDPVFAPPSAKPPPEHGLLVTAVVPGSPAAQAGLKAGDVLLAFGKHKLQSVDDLSKALAEGPGRARYWREGVESTTREIPAGRLGVTLDRHPAPQAVARWREASTSLVSRGTGHKRLPATEHEARTLAAMVKGSKLLLGSDASEQALDRLLADGSLKRFRLLHFATHGQIDDRTPDRSALILAQDRLPDPLAQPPDAKRYTGELTVETIRRSWSLDADLVVLSACDTGLGKDAGGDGLLGFAHALLARGARTVVLSRWKVDDSATALLMLRFYENLLGTRKDSRPQGRAAALAEAKTWLRTLPRAEAERKVGALTGGVLRGSEVEVPPIKDGAKPALPAGDRPYEHPFYWAAFLLVGDPD